MTAHALLPTTTRLATPSTCGNAKPALHPPPRRITFLSAPSRSPLRCAAAGGDDPDLAVFRFTLGIPGFDDALVPRVVGGVGGMLLVVNHFLAGNEPSAAQTRAEVLGALLAAVAFATPTLEQRLVEAQPGRGRLAASAQVAGSANVFALCDALSEATRRELAWASYALLRNANICGLAVIWDGKAVMCRGSVGASVAASGAATALAAATQAWQEVPIRSGGDGESLYCSTRGDIARRGLDSCALVPTGAHSVLVQPLLPMAEERAGSGGGGSSSRGVLVLMSERQRALSSKERAWAQAIAAKLQSALTSR